jgi:predicted transcriptional regulator YdeE
MSKPETTKKGPTMTEIIDFFRERLEARLLEGMQLKDATLQVQIETETQFRGERVYIAGPSRQIRARQIAKLGQMKLRDMAVTTGVPVRTLARIRNGK